MSAGVEGPDNLVSDNDVKKAMKDFRVWRSFPREKDASKWKDQHPVHCRENLDKLIQISHLIVIRKHGKRRFDQLMAEKYPAFKYKQAKKVKKVKKAIRKVKKATKKVKTVKIANDVETVEIADDVETVEIADDVETAKKVKKVKKVKKAMKKVKN